MQQYFLDASYTDLTVGQLVFLNGEDSHHLLTVLRSRLGKEVYLVAGDQKFLARLQSNQENRAGLELISILDKSLTQTELPVEVTIACGLSKNDKLETIVQKGTECGMSVFQPLALKRDVVKWEAKKAAGKIERLEKIAKAAAEQSKRLVQPEILPLISLEQLVSQSVNFDHKLIAYEEEAKSGQHGQLAETISQLEPGQGLLIVFGSEGGLALEEVDYLITHGFRTCSLGPRILRAETAPIYALSIVSYVTEIQKER